MAETRDSHGKEPASRKQDPAFSHSPDAGGEGAEGAPAGLRRPAAKKSKKGSWFQENRTLAIGAAAGAGALAIVLVLGLAFGWFGGGSKAKPGATPSPPAVAAQPAAPQASPSTASPLSGTPGQLPSQDAAKNEPKKEQTPPLPDDVAKWKQEDYRRARRNNDVKLLPAIVHLGEKRAGDEKAAEWLTELLKPLPPEKPPVAAGTPSPGSMSQPGSGLPGTMPYNPGANPNVPGARPYSQGELTQLVATIIESLGSNGSGAARGTIEKVIAGTFVTDDDKAAVEAALKTLAAHRGTENEALLLRVLTAAKDVRPADRQGVWPAKDLEAKAFELVKPSASGALRTKLAASLIDRNPRIDPKEPTSEFLLAADPLNCGAQLLFYEKSDLKRNKDVRSTLEQQLAGYSSLALARCLRVPADSLPATGGYRAPMSMPSAGRFNPPPVNAGGFHAPRAGSAASGGPGETANAPEVDLGPQLAGQLWSDGFRALIEAPLADPRSFDRQPQLLVLAATIPADSTRAVLFKTLKKHWNDGPKALETAGLIDRVIADPGLVAIVKMCPRKESVSTPRASSAATARRGRSGASGVPAGGGRMNDVAMKKQQAEQDWMDVSARLTFGWCKRFSAAAAAKEASGASDKSGGDAGDFKLPDGFELAPEAKVVASHRVVLPGAAPAGFSQLQPGTLEVYYVRAEESNKTKKAIVYYNRQASGRLSDARTFEGKTWIDSIRPGSQKDRRRSVDVLIGRPDGAPAAAPADKGNGDEEVDLTIEVLIVEIKDPNKD